MLTLALAGFAINLLLFVRHLAGDAIAGCGSGSACGEMLNSRWSRVLGVPVTVFGGLAYLALIFAWVARLRVMLDMCLGLILGAAAWFVFVQAALVGHFCPWCMSAHGIGTVIFLLGMRLPAAGGGTLSPLRTIGLAAGCSVIGIALLQWAGPLPVTHRIGGFGGTQEGIGTSIHARGTGRKVSFDGGRKIYDLTAMPHLGEPAARRVLVEYFDYSCPACQRMSGYLTALMAQHPADICVVVLPVPLNRSCNHALASGETQHPESCELARLALALWHATPQAFATFHQALLDGASVGSARAMALKSLPANELAATLRDPWIDELIQADIRDWISFSSDTPNLPKLLISDKRILHGLPSGQADFIRVMEHELGL